MKVTFQKILFYNVVLIILVFTVISPQLINLYIENTSLNTSSGNINSATNRSFGIRNSVSTGVIGATTNYIPGSSIEIAGFLDYMQQYVNIISDPGKASNYYQFVPGQNNFSIYIQNPNNTADKLMIIGGKNQTTTGKDANAPFGVDDNLYTFSGLTYLTSSNLTQYNKIQSINQTGSVGYFDLLARLPSSSELSTLGIAYGSVTLYVVFGGNITSTWNSPNLPSWTVKTYTITISNSANLQASPSPTSTFIVPNYPRNSSIFNATLTDGATGPISGQAFNYAVYNNATDPTHTGIPLCSGITNGASNCSSVNISLIPSPLVTNSAGNITFTVGLTNWSSINTIYQYAFKIYANANLTGPTPYANTPFVVENFTFERQQGNIQINSKNPNTTTLRPSENVSLTVLSYLNATGQVFPSVPITPVLYNRSTNTVISSGTNGFTVSYGSGTTNNNGLLTIDINTSRTTPTGRYGLKIPADFTSFTGNPNYLITNVTSSVVWYNFSLDPMYDNFAVIFYSATPQNTTTITPQPAPGNITQVTLKAFILYNTSWLSYNSGYLATAPAVGIPINASLETPGSNLTLSIANITNNQLATTGYYYTNSTGYIVFNITATYPLTYVQILEKMTIQANLPGSSTDAFLRYYNTGTKSYTTTPSFILPTTGPFSVDPGYVPINITLATPATNATYIHPGEAILLNFKAFYTNNLTAIGGVPVNFSIALTTVTGLYLTDINGNPLTTSSSLLTNASGEISIILHSTYNVTIESETSIIIDITAIANITAFNILKGTNQPSTYTRPYYTGMYHQGTGTFADYSKTWSSVTNPVTLKAGYVFVVPNWQNTVTIRPGTNTTVIMTVKNNVTNTAITGIQFPVSVTAECYNVNTSQQYTSCSSVGVSLSVQNQVYNPPFNTSFYYTNSSSGQLKITVLTSIRFYPNPLPKYINITLNATIDFKDKLSTTLTNTTWYVGTTQVGSYNLSEDSVSVNNNLYPVGRVNQDPQYKYATMVAVLPTANQTVQPSNTITLQYRVSIINDTGQIEYLDNVSVQLNTTLLNMFSMTSLQLQNTTYTNSKGYATFNLEPTNKTNNGSYFMQAIANLGANKTLVNSSINGYWINGTIFVSGNNTYSTAKSLNFTVERVPTLSVNILRVLTGNKVYSSSAPFYAHRGDTLELNLTYKDSTGGLYSSNGPIIIYYNSSSNIPNTNNILINSSLGTITNGVLVANVTLPASSNIIVGPSIIWANDTGAPIKIIHNGAQVDVVTTTTFTPQTINTYGKTFLTTGDRVTVSGVLKDDLGNVINNTLYPASVLGELNNSLLIYGVATNNASAIGIQATTPNTATGAFTLTFTLPGGYTQQTLPIYLDLQNNTAVIIDFIHTPLLVVNVNTYQYLKALTLQLSGTGIAYSTSSNNTSYQIKNNTNGYTVIITVQDNFGRNIASFTFNTIIGTSPNPSSFTTNNNGQLSIVGSPAEYTNSTAPRTIVLQYTNGTLSNSWSLSITRTVFDRTPPSIVIVQPVFPYNTSIDQNTLINMTLSDGNPATMVATGINITSFTITIKDNNNNVLSPSSVLLNPACNLSPNGYTYVCIATVNFISLPITVTNITLTIFVRDNGIESSTLNYVLSFDRSAPQFDLGSLTPTNNAYIAAHAILSLIVVDPDRNGVATVSAQVTIGGTTTTYQLSQTNPALHLWSSPSIDFSSMARLDINATVVFIAKDVAGNTNTTTILYLADTVAPAIAIDHYASLANSVHYVPFTITVHVSDTQSGINASSLTLISGQVRSLSLQSITSINGIYSYAYVITVTPNINSNFDTQSFSISIFDYAGNSNTTNMAIRTDIYSPALHSIQVTDKNNKTLYSSSAPAGNTSFIETGLNVNSNHKLVFFYTDPTVAGLSSGINVANTTTTLLIWNQTIQRYQAINFAAYGLDIHVIIGTNNVTIMWLTSSNDTRLIGLSGQGGTGSFAIGLQWEISLKDNAGHTTPITFDYTYQIYIPTIQDAIVSFLTTAIIAITIFGATGIILAVIYERIRFEK